MSTQKTNSKAKRSTASILAETILCKELGWKIGFISGGIGIYKHDEFLGLLKKITQIYGKKVWANVGPLSEKQLEELKPYLEGVVGSIETVNKEIHDYMCPSKPTKPYEEMFENANKLGLKNAMTIILGLGETLDDFDLLKEYIEKYNIQKIKFYALNPIKGSELEDYKTPSAEYQSEWIEKTRQAFPTIEISFGIWLDKIDRVSLLLDAGANYITKFPMTKAFGSKEVEQLVKKVEKSGREFKSSIVKLPDKDWNKVVDQLDFEEKEEIRKKLFQYLKRMGYSLEQCS